MTSTIRSILANPSSATNASVLEELGVSAEELIAYATDSIRAQSPRSIAAGLIETPDGNPIPGISYQCDYRAEEEWGIADLRKAITGEESRNFQMTKQGRACARIFSDVNGFALSTRPLDPSKDELLWGDSLSGYDRPDEPAYVQHFVNSLPYMTRPRGLEPERRVKMDALRKQAKELGISPMPRRKQDLYLAVAAALPSENHGVWPGWFHDGKTLVVRADGDDLSSRIVRRLVKAIERGTLAIGSSSGPFRSGFFLYDASDETPGLKAERKSQHDWYEARMEELEPVANALRADGIRWFFLGNPREIADRDSGEVKLRYWLNGMQGGGARKQPYGWYTLEELAEKKFIADFA